jgi:hypothetical protein
MIDTKPVKLCHLSAATLVPSGLIALEVTRPLLTRILSPTGEIHWFASRMRPPTCSPM